ncbi:MAG: hypothetical protein ATN35_01155 [Epulopiscium sp. Nele67-Bin004]|nr:MAG: hypothetical protein ATN35_01155 [Epulopiscium sp. Nele67-Bin004]
MLALIIIILILLTLFIGTTLFRSVGVEAEQAPHPNNMQEIELEPEQEETEEETEEEIEEESEEAEEDMEEEQDITTYWEEKAELVTSDDDTVTFVDALGHTKTLEKKPQRVVSLTPSPIGLWYEAGGKIVGRVHSPYDEFLPEEALEDEVEVIGNSWEITSIRLESVMATNPDLVILDKDKIIFAQPLAIVGIKTIIVDYADIRDYLKWFKVFSLLNNEEELYDNVAKQTLDYTLAVIERVPVVERPKVLCLNVDKTSITANLSNTMLGTIVNELGGINVAGNYADPENEEISKIEVTLEAMVESNPDKILVHQFTDDGTVQTILEQIFETNPILKTLNAVKNNEIYYLDMSLFACYPNKRYNEAYSEVLKMLYQTKEETIEEASEIVEAII